MELQVRIESPNSIIYLNLEYDIYIQGIVDVPFYFVADLFEYWPFGKALSIYWACYDNNINTTTNLHMLYMVNFHKFSKNIRHKFVYHSHFIRSMQQLEVYKRQEHLTVN